MDKELQDIINTYTKDPRRYKLYIRDPQLEFWKIFEYAKERNQNPSIMICDIVLEAIHDLEKNKYSEKKEEVLSTAAAAVAVAATTTPATDDDENINHLTLLLKASKAYSQKRNNLKSQRISSLLPTLFESGKIKSEEMINLILFVVEIYITLMHTDCHKNFLLEKAPQLMNSFDLIKVPNRFARFKEKLRQEIFVDVDRIQREKQEEANRILKEKEAADLAVLQAVQRKEREAERQKRLEWAKQTGLDPDYYGMDELEIKTSKFIGRNTQQARLLTMEGGKKYQLDFSDPHYKKGKVVPVNKDDVYAYSAIAQAKAIDDAEEFEDVDSKNDEDILETDPGAIIVPHLANPDPQQEEQVQQPGPQQQPRLTRRLQLQEQEQLKKIEQELDSTTPMEVGYDAGLIPWAKPYVEAIRKQRAEQKEKEEKEKQKNEPIVFDHEPDLRNPVDREKLLILAERSHQEYWNSLTQSQKDRITRRVLKEPVPRRSRSRSKNKNQK